MKNVRVKVEEFCRGYLWDVGIFEGRKKIIVCEESYRRKSSAIRRAKTIARRTGIPYDPEIIKQHGC